MTLSRLELDIPAFEECGNVLIRQIYSTKETVCMSEIPLILLLCECVL